MTSVAPTGSTQPRSYARLFTGDGRHDVGDRIYRALIVSAVIFFAGLAVAVGATLLAASVPAIRHFGFGFLTTRVWDVPHTRFGAAPFLFGSLVTTALAVAIATPLGVLGAAFLACVAPRRVGAWLSGLLELFAAVPSVILGLWGLQTLCPWMAANLFPQLQSLGGRIPFFRGPAVPTNLLTASLILALMIMPIIAALSADVLRTLPSEWREGALALGASRWETIRRLLIPAARGGLGGAVALAVARAIGETMAVLMVIGNTPQITASILQPASTIPSQLAGQINEVLSDPIQRSALALLAFTLFALTVGLRLLAHGLLPRKGSFDSGRRSSAPVQSDTPLTIEQVTKPAAGTPLPQRARPVWYRKTADLVFATVLWGAVLVCVGAMLAVLISVLQQGARGVNLTFFTHLPPPPGDTGGGMQNGILGTVELLGLAMALSVPIGVLGGIGIFEMRGSRLAELARGTADVLAGAPSIVIGMCVFALVVVPFARFSAWAGAAALAILMVPLIIRATDEMLAQSPAAWREGALALGASPGVAMRSIVVPTALGGIVTGILLAASRAAGETAPLLLTAFGNEVTSVNPGQPISSITLLIYRYALSPFDGWVSLAWTGAVVLLLLVLAMQITARLLASRISSMPRQA
ncbi:MAG: phosphate ABC transporter permease subunit PstC [Armatimonadetes bacterium]|nr:phosphate ABC transporter permease subunit PstC [Armatimonadota bacterium]MDE2205738.1 phosphate ABC transporter permease subunit PstC [Armatimonadota bacterium]